MQFFDLQRPFKLQDFIWPTKTLADLSNQEWFLAKIRVEYDCLHTDAALSGQVVLCSNQQIQLELSWCLQDTGHELQVLFVGIETEVKTQTLVMLKGAELVDEQQQSLSAQALSLWIDGTLLPMLPNIRRDIKAYLNLWDYADYQD